MKLKSEIKTITPAYAAKLLEGNTRNRSINSRNVTNLARDMKNGIWALNGESIKVSGDILIDGQHRLLACIQSGANFETLFVSGVSKDVFDTVDAGKKRNDVDVFYIRGEKNTSYLSTGLKVVDRYISGRALDRSVQYTNQEMEKLLDQHGDIRESATYIRRLRPNGLGSTGTMVGLHYLFSLSNREKADEFMSMYIDGYGLEEGSPIALMRKKMMKISLQKGSALRPHVFQAMLIKTWNAWVKGKVLKQIAFMQKEGKNEKFPKIING